MTGLYTWVRRAEKTLRRRGLAGTAALLPAVLARAARDRLPSGRARRLAFRREDQRFDVEHGVDTAGRTYLSSLQIESPTWIYGERYQPVAPALFHQAMAAFTPPHAGFTFIDIGSGKGRALLLAAEYPFRRIVGVEFAPELHAAACRNLDRCRNAPLRCREIEAVNVDALEYALPEEPLLLYLYNPFGPEVMAPFVERLRQSLKRSPRPLHTLYASPMCAALLDGSGFLRRRAEGREWILYEPSSSS